MFWVGSGDSERELLLFLMLYSQSKTFSVCGLNQEGVTVRKLLLKSFSPARNREAGINKNKTKNKQTKNPNNKDMAGSEIPDAIVSYRSRITCSRIMH